MKLAKLLKPEAVRVIGSMSSKKRLFHELGEIAQSVHGLPHDPVVEALMERENLGPTGVGQGVALPHARLGELDQVKGVFLKIERPMDFRAVDRQPVDLVFCLFAPENSGVDHLKALAVVSRTLRDSDLCAKLRANDDVAALHAMLTELPDMRAA
ncbi:PTS sugar transporter subunit IIA [Profundibacterium mesophilum]|uniref:PTS IIA-like nitrogen-regulatory protein PtsN n=1 Tax=Profundibacterium mesophilum KAUST100406-0324 TaxID=1037889 RepID=A0A921NRH1_9RHOB|nr:PTS sugar transporter subunit IIA [Profundibacterium mesophilum]KAF0676385.1 PTS IIA-like nitrogen-regulatory protein PtsN [Profundibacterium mesophilum KAUST100406-0324]